MEAHSDTSPPSTPSSLEMRESADASKGQGATLDGERGVRLLHSWEEARQRAYDCAQPLPAHAVPLRQGTGRILARDIVALQDMPHYASSAMDGWAVAGSPPWILAEPGQRLVSGQASPIVTGALIPPGAKSVL
ncbi:MAG TPA: molybdopterin molybdenumtransferase MoeA, partial [Micrococcaceae bacterium]|nr:molybdopterin molybdenumtransferase MoeA [Micrococcaceae bacterium]